MKWPSAVPLLNEYTVGLHHPPNSSRVASRTVLRILCLVSLQRRCFLFRVWAAESGHCAGPQTGERVRPGGRVTSENDLKDLCVVSV